MNRVEPIAWGSASHRAATVPAPARVPTELSILAVAMAGELFGALTHPFAGALAGAAVAVLLTLRRIGADVRAMHAWEAGQE
jgi:hypothetical protein